MWRIIATFSAGVFTAVVAIGMLLSRLHGSMIEWRVLTAIAGGAAAVTALRLWLLLKKESARLSRQHIAFAEAMQELIDTMARASFVDLSIFITAQQYACDPEDPLIFVTSKGSYNHEVLVQMADLRLAKPRRMQELAPGYVRVDFELTRGGRDALGSLLESVAKRRAHFASLAAGD